MKSFPTLKVILMMILLLFIELICRQIYTYEIIDKKPQLIPVEVFVSFTGTPVTIFRHGNYITKCPNGYKLIKVIKRNYQYFFTSINEEEVMLSIPNRVTNVELFLSHSKNYSEEFYKPVEQ